MAKETDLSTRTRGLLLGAIVAALLGGLTLWLGLGNDAAWTAAVTGICATWWVLEPVPIPVTSLIPFAFFPLAGVLDDATVAKQYGHEVILLLMGGFMLSTAVERSGVHRRLALGMVRVAGRGGRRLVLGFMLASGLCSMWISNTATTLMLLPVALAVLGTGVDRRLAVPLLLGIAYAASIGGMATPIGTPPNLIFMGQYQENTGRAISFLAWMKIGVPVVVLFIPLAWLYISRRLGGVDAPQVGELGPWKSAEKRVLLVFALTALAWIFRQEPLGGWSELIHAGGAGDSTVALAAVLVLCLVPDGAGGRLLDWDTARRIPWGLLLLFGGGLAISAAFTASGLSQALGEAIGSAARWHTLALIATVCIAVTFLTEVTSNTATTTLLMPVLYAAAVGVGIEPALLMIPATLSASCAFMLPVATPPNAIMSGTGHVPTAHMAREGLALNFIGAVVIAVVSYLVLPL